MKTNHHFIRMNPCVKEFLNDFQISAVVFNPDFSISYVNMYQAAMDSTLMAPSLLF